MIGQHTIGKVVKNIMKDAGIEGFFTNHSARRTGSTRLFRAGVDRKLVKEVTGHRSDVVDKYQITSDEQRKMLSEIIAKNPLEKVDQCPNSERNELEQTAKSTVSVSQNNATERVECQCNGKKLNPNDIGTLVTELVRETSKNKKTVIRLEIEIIND